MIGKLLGVFLAFALFSFTGAQVPEWCEPLTIPFCMDLPYNHTYKPSDKTQEEAQLDIFIPLAQANCSLELKTFICNVYAPVCTVLEQPMRPCKSLCLSVKNGCEKLLDQWPADLDCNQFPVPENGTVCITDLNDSSEERSN